MMKEYGELENDLKLVQTICKTNRLGKVFQFLSFTFTAEQAARLRSPHKELDEAVKSLLGNLSKQVGTANVNLGPV